MVSLFELHITMKGPLKKIKIKSQLAFTKKTTNIAYYDANKPFLSFFFFFSVVCGQIEKLIYFNQIIARTKIRKAKMQIKRHRCPQKLEAIFLNFNHVIYLILRTYCERELHSYNEDDKNNIHLATSVDLPFTVPNKK